MSFVDRHRASRLLDRAGFDAIVVAEPEGFRTVSGVPQGVASPVPPCGRRLRSPAGRPGVADRHRDRRPHGGWRAPHGAGRQKPSSLDGARHDRGYAGGPVRSRPASPKDGGLRAGGPGFVRPATFDLRLALEALRGLLADRGLSAARLGCDLDYVTASDAEVIRDALSPCTVGNGLAGVRPPPHGQDTRRDRRD